jgi:hypothetical protein
MPLCQYCNNERSLISAHIIPKSFWNIDKEDGGPLAVLNSRSNWKPQRSQQGEYDRNILCEACDNKLGVLDQHAYENLVNVQGTPIVNSERARAIKYESADAKTIHAFVASVAWRSSKSKRDFSTRINLGPYEKIYFAAFNGDEDALKSLDCFIAEFDERNVSFLNPQYSTMGGVKFVVIYANRFTFYIKADKRKIPDIFRPFAITNGQPVLSLVRTWIGSKQHEAMVKVVKSNPRPRFWKELS